MTLNIYLLFFAFLFSLILYVYILYINEENFNYVIKEDNKRVEDITNNLNTVNQVMSVNTQDPFIGKPKKVKTIRPEKKIEIKLKLKKYNQQLKRCLNTLTYISVMEVDSLTNQDQLKNLLNLKESMQFEVVRITRQINHYKSLIGDSIAA